MYSFSARVRVEGRTLWSRNALKGVSLRGERLKREGRKEWRQWSPYTSKIAAGLLKCENSGILPPIGSTCLYLGSGHGTTISHLHDQVCGAKNQSEGTIVAVDLSPHCIRDIIHLAESRPGIVPVLADCRDLTSISPFLCSKVPWLFQDVSQSGQVDIFIQACNRYLAPRGTGILSLKSQSERDASGAFAHAEDAIIKAGFTIVEKIDLTGWEEKHMLFHVVK